MPRRFSVWKRPLRWITCARGERIRNSAIEYAIVASQRLCASRPRRESGLALTGSSAGGMSGGPEETGGFGGFLSFFASGFFEPCSFIRALNFAAYAGDASA